MEPAVYWSLAISLGLGLLVGLQREWKESEVAGIRTFPLITLLGTLTVLANEGEPGWLTGVGLLGVICLLVLANLAKLKDGQRDAGMTTEAAALLMFVVGATLAAGHSVPAIVAAGVTAVLLHWKQPLHGFVDRVGKSDLRALFQLVLIALVILPVLPDETYGPYEVLNPYKIWLLVVLIVGISLSAYIAYRWLGARVGAVLGGLLGGLISSTATTVSYARQTKDNVDASRSAAVVIMLASTVVNVRVLFEIGVVAPGLLRATLGPLLSILLLMSVECAVLLYMLRGHETTIPDHENPAQLKAAILFGALYAVILFVVAATKHHFGDRALYVVAAISGLTDVDAITLSTAKLFADERLAGSTAWRTILIATLSNLVFKGAAVAMLGNRRLLVYISVLFGIALAGGGLLLAFWPEYEIPLSLESLKSPNV